jgi:hypothetical protein
MPDASFGPVFVTYTFPEPLRSFNRSIVPVKYHVVYKKTQRKKKLTNGPNDTDTTGVSAVTVAAKFAVFLSKIIVICTLN